MKTISETAAWEKVARMATLLSKGSPAEATRLGGTLYDLAQRMLTQLEEGVHRNPPLMLYGNPPRGASRFGRRVYGIDYQHADDRKDYRHEFKGGVGLYELPSGAVLLAHDQGKNLVRDFPA